MSLAAEKWWPHNRERADWWDSHNIKVTAQGGSPAATEATTIMKKFGFVMNTINMSMMSRIKPFVHAAILLAAMVTVGCSGPAPQDQILISEDPWEKYDKAAEEAIKNQRYDLAEKFISRAKEEFRRRTGLGGGWYSELSIIFIMQGRYNEAAEAEIRYFQTRSGMSLGDIDSHYCELGDIYMAQGKYQMALENYNLSYKSAEEKARREPHNAGFTYLDPHFGNYYLQQGDYEKAIRYLKENLDWYAAHSSMSMRIARAKNALAMMYYYAGDDLNAEKLFREAAGLNENATVGFPEDLAQSLTMLGRIAEHRGQRDEVLEFYRSAREALHMYRTVIHKVEEADVLNQIGKFQLTQGKPVEARDAYQEAIRLRKETTTATHPNCADAIKGLADVAAYRSELTSATLQAREALKILDTAVVPSHPRLSIELVALSSIETLAGHPEQAAPLGARLETILQKPLGPWKEDFLATTAFYAGLLKKAGKTEESARLEQLYARQKSRH